MLVRRSHDIGQSWALGYYLSMHCAPLVAYRQSFAALRLSRLIEVLLSGRSEIWSIVQLGKIWPFVDTSPEFFFYFDIFLRFWENVIITLTFKHKCIDSKIPISLYLKCLKSIYIRLKKHTQRIGNVLICKEHQLDLCIFCSISKLITFFAYTEMNRWLSLIVFNFVHVNANKTHQEHYNCLFCSF